MHLSKSADKMVNFETLTLCMSLNSSQICTYFCKDLVRGFCLYLVKKFDSRLLSVCRYGADIT